VSRPAPLGRDAFRVFRPISTRWADNDVFGHVNNVVYYAWFDTAVTGWLLSQDMIATAASPTIFVVAETACAYFESVAFPDEIEVGIAAERIGSSSVTYRIGVFRTGGTRTVAQGRFVHVHVTREGQRPEPLTLKMRAKFEAIV
jgi:acyl-CoA thioester hydrolase